MMVDSKYEQILDVAEAMVRRAGYNGVSYREIAKAVGIKSASVHYHFPTKEDLGEAIAQRYTKRFFDRLGSARAAVARGDDPVALITTAFRSSLERDGSMCLCGLLGAEAQDLPPLVLLAARGFFKQALDWLKAGLTEQGLDAHMARRRAAHTLSLLEGSMLISVALNEPAFVDDALQAVA